MALNPALIQFFVDEIQKANTNTFSGVIAQLFEHLSTEIKDNPVYDLYEGQIERWDSWPNGEESVSFRGNDWEIPKKFDDAKTLAYSLYRKIGTTGEFLNLIFAITSEGNFKTGILEFNHLFLNFFAKSLEEIMNANPEFEKADAKKVLGKNVFIIHGHDDLLKKDVQLLLHRAGVNNIVLHEQPDKGRTIIDKLVDEGNNSNYSLALLSPDDVLNNGKSRARQNVILEIGYFLGQLGKERVRMLIKDDVEIPSDLQGILYEKFDDAGLWKIKILKELVAVGIYADIHNVVESI